MTTYVYRNGEMVEKSIADALYSDDGPRLRYISDHMDPLQHPVSGKTYDSKSEFRRATKAAGCIEVGDQKDYGIRREKPKLDKRERVEHIKRSIQELKNRG